MISATSKITYFIGYLATLLWLEKGENCLTYRCSYTSGRIQAVQVKGY